jgi:hypothetical protein
VPLSILSSQLGEGRAEELRFSFHIAAPAQNKDSGYYSGALGGFQSTPWDEPTGSRSALILSPDGIPAQQIGFHIQEASFFDVKGHNTPITIHTTDTVGMVVIRGLDVLFFTGAWAAGWPSLDALTLRGSARRQMGTNANGMFSIWLNRATGTGAAEQGLLLAASFYDGIRTVVFEHIRLQALKLQ